MPASSTLHRQIGDSSVGCTLRYGRCTRRASASTCGSLYYQQRRRRWRQLVTQVESFLACSRRSETAETGRSTTNSSSWWTRRATSTARCWTPGNQWPRTSSLTAGTI
ncbi:hypothetical protein F443_07587 [Phytophthora nicotianae P1569]|uniref:Uncharacterized protein n=1 Tax=Phytophthora nicotianae P1569 TaxID=1317065 RepID=V9FBA7_PHYNI|nr:hypothetical protein F443_07587 [Phytophthora nicotianae P1569]